MLENLYATLEYLYVQAVQDPIKFLKWILAMSVYPIIIYWMFKKIK